MVYTGIVLRTDLQGIPLNEAEIKQRRKFIFHVKYPSLSPIVTKLMSIEGSAGWLFMLEFLEVP